MIDRLLRALRRWFRRDPLRRIIDTFPANDPAKYRLHVDAMYLATMEVAAEFGPCPSCGAIDGEFPTTDDPKVMRPVGGAGPHGRCLSAKYCGVCDTLCKHYPDDYPKPLPPLKGIQPCQPQRQ